jgi:hypothetical protein
MSAARKDADTIQYGFKRVTPTNLVKEDNHPSYPSGPRHEQWLQACLKPKLDPMVPEEIAFLFEVARGSMAYSWFFLPLASLAAEQSYRVLEAAARARCQQLGLLKSKRAKMKPIPDTPFADVVAALQKAGRIPTGDVDAWTNMPFLRNCSSHPASQTILDRRKAAESLAYHCQLLNRLFQ